jgi:peptidoglycan/xylan/chitin deacetylase (PgdA/CDA1 family)
MRFFRPFFFYKWVFPGALFSIRARGKTLCLTFDDGPDPFSTPLISAILEKNGIKAVFFCNGQKAEANPDLVKDLKSGGHLIGNHGYRHLDGWRTETDQYLQNALLADHSTSDSLFRPPFGRIKFSQYRKISRKYQVVFWDLMPYDFDNDLDAGRCLEILKANMRPGSVIVLHDTPESSASLFLNDFIAYSVNNGYHFGLP